MEQGLIKDCMSYAQKNNVSGKELSSILSSMIIAETLCGKSEFAIKVGQIGDSSDKEWCDFLTSLSYPVDGKLPEVQKYRILCDLIILATKNEHKLMNDATDKVAKALYGAEFRKTSQGYATLEECKEFLDSIINKNASDEYSEVFNYIREQALVVQAIPKLATFDYSNVYLPKEYSKGINLNFRDSELPSTKRFPTSIKGDVYQSIFIVTCINAIFDKYFGKEAAASSGNIGKLMKLSKSDLVPINVYEGYAEIPRIKYPSAFNKNTAVISIFNKTFNTNQGVDRNTLQAFLKAIDGGIL